MTMTDAAPWWPKLSAWAAIVLIAIGLVYQLATRITDDVQNIRENFALHHEESERLNRSIERYMELQTMLTRQLCVNAAGTTDERSACFKP